MNTLHVKSVQMVTEITPLSGKFPIASAEIVAVAFRSEPCNLHQRFGTQGDIHMARPAALAYDDVIVDFAHERIDALMALVERLGRFRAEDTRVEFTRLFNNAVLALELSDVALAEMFKISRPTAGRWMRGDSAPHPLGRNAVFDVLMREAKGKLRTINGRI